MFGAGPALAADSGPLHGAWTDRPGRPQAVRGRVTLQGLIFRRGRPTAGQRQARRPPPALTGRTRARPTRFREPPRPPSAARLPRDALSGSRGLGLGGGPDPPCRRPWPAPFPSPPACRRRPRLGGACPSRPPPAFRRAPASRFPTCPARLGRSAPPVAPVPPIDGRRAYMRAGGKPNFGTAAGRARMPGRLRKNCL